MTDVSMRVTVSAVAEVRDQDGNLELTRVQDGPKGRTQRPNEKG